jgi:hypothetical protein
VGTPFNRLYFQLAPSTLHTDATEFGLSLIGTPTAKSGGGRSEKFRKGRVPTPQKIANNYGNLLPTVTTHQQNTKFKQGGTCLQAHFNNLLPTPMAQESDKITGKENKDSLTKRARLETGKTSQLNPHFVEEMMGFPKNWTLLPFQNGEENQSKHTETP